MSMPNGCLRCRLRPSASSSEIDERRGVHRQAQKVVVLWKLDNKPPHGPPYDAVMALKRMAQCFGYIVDISTYANCHAFNHLPQWVLEERREPCRLDILNLCGKVG